MSVVQCHHWGVAGSMFHAESNHHSKFIRSELMNTPGRGILWHSRKKISTAPVSHAPQEQESDFLRSFRRLHVRLQSHTCSIRARHPPTTDATMFSYTLCLKAIDRYDIYAVLSSICRSRSCEYHHERGLILFGNV